MERPSVPSSLRPWGMLNKMSPVASTHNTPRPDAAQQDDEHDDDAEAPSCNSHDPGDAHCFRFGNACNCLMERVVSLLARAGGLFRLCLVTASKCLLCWSVLMPPCQSSVGTALVNSPGGLVLCSDDLSCGLFSFYFLFFSVVREPASE